ncbi:MAG: hypothetical protein ACTSX9_02815 [Candidatus Njordarchaeales archaeon]
MKSDTLLILPCNPGAKNGNYFESKSWEIILRIYSREKIDLSRIQFAAVDSIITFKDPNNDKERLGAVVLATPEEMIRVKGHDIKPSWIEFVRNNFENLYKHAYYVKIGLKRILSKYHFEWIIVILNVRAYRLATYKALIEIGEGKLPRNAFFFDCPDSPAWLIHCAKASAKLLKNIWTKEHFPGGVIAVTKKVKKYLLVKGRPKNVPEEFAYWKHNHKEIIIDI